MVPSHQILHAFFTELSKQYLAIVPDTKIVQQVCDAKNADFAADHAEVIATIPKQFFATAQHGAIRILPGEMPQVARVFAVLGMHAVGRYDLKPGHTALIATAFRRIDQHEKNSNPEHDVPIRIFTSQAVIDEASMPEEIHAIYARMKTRRLFSDAFMAKVEAAEKNGITEAQLTDYITTMVEQFVPVSPENEAASHKTIPNQADFETLWDYDPILADILCFPLNFNHTTLPTMDVEGVRVALKEKHSLNVIARTQGPEKPAGEMGAYLRQASITAPQRMGPFKNDAGESVYKKVGTNFTEFEDIGFACKRDDASRAQILGYAKEHGNTLTFEKAVELGLAFYKTDRSGKKIPIIDRDFLPMSAAGIFQSNLGENSEAAQEASIAQNDGDFKALTGCDYIPCDILYEKEQAAGV